MKTAPRFPTGYPSPLWFFVSLFGRVSRGYPGRGCMRGAQPLIRGSEATVPGRYPRGLPWQGRRRVGWMDGPSIGLRADGWECGHAARPWPRVGDGFVSLGCVVGTDCGRPPPTGTTAIRGKPSTVPWVFTAGLHGLPAPSRVLDLPCVTSRRVMGAFTRDLFLIGEAVQPPSRSAYVGRERRTAPIATDKLRTFA